MFSAFPNKRRRISARLLLPPIAALALSGCAGLHLHDPEAAKLSADVKTKANAVNFVAMIEQERDNQASLLQHELAVVGDFAIARRNAELRYLTEIAPNSSQHLSDLLRKEIDKRVNEVGGKDVLTAVIELKTAEALLNDSYTQPLRKYDISIPPCTSSLEATDSLKDKFRKTAVDTLGATVSDYPIIDGEVIAYVDQCKIVQGLAAELASASQAYATLLAANEAYALNEKEIRSRQADLKTARSDLERAKKALKDAKDTNKPANTVTRLQTQLNAARDAFATAAGLLAKAQSDAENNYLSGLQDGVAAIETNICRLDRILGAARENARPGNDGGAGSTGASTSANICETEAPSTAVKAIAGDPEVLKSFSGLLSGLTTLRDAANRVPVQALVLEKERLAFEKTVAQNRLKRANTRRQLHQAFYDNIIKEAKLLNTASVRLGWALNASGRSQIRIEDLFNDQYCNGRPSNCVHARRYLVEAVAVYLNTFTGPRKRRHEIQYELLSLQHADILDKSEASHALGGGYPKPRRADRRLS